MINQVTLLGRVGKDPEIRYTNDNKAVAMFSIATNELGKDKTTWHNVKAWEQKADLCEKYVKKGDLLFVQGRIEYTEKDGKHYTAVVIQNMQFLSSKGGSQSQASNKDNPVPQPPQKQNRQPNLSDTKTAINNGFTETVKQSDDLGDDDIPF